MSVFLFIFSIAFVSNVFAQSRCFTDEETKKIIASINAPSLSENKPVRNELLKMRKDSQDLAVKIIKNPGKNQELIAERETLGERNIFRLCEIIKTEGWLTKQNIGEDGVKALLHTIKNHNLNSIKKEFFPVLEAAVKAGHIENQEFATLIDDFRISFGVPQLFGTQIYFKDEAIYLYPLLNQRKIDEWRKIYDLPPLHDFIKDLEVNFRLPVIKTANFRSAPQVKMSAGESTETDDLGLSADAEETIKVDTNLVNLNVRILNKDFSIPRQIDLTKDDFSIFENGVSQNIDFFSTTNKEFDLVLVLDLSGSMREKTGVLIESTKRFIDAARPGDRIAIVSFGDEVKIESDFTDDKKVLLKKAGNIGYRGSSKVWDALDFVYRRIIGKDRNRRSAIVFMTDGVDNTLIMDAERWNNRKTPAPITTHINLEDFVSKVTFAELLEIAKDSDTTVFPIYIDTETLDNEPVKKAYRTARRMLEILAEETGGQYYYAKKVKDLSGIYEKIINDLGKVYSLGYEPRNELKDGKWRELKVEIKNRNDMIVRTRSGYYAR